MMPQTIQPRAVAPLPHSFFEADFKAIYPEPSPEVLAKAYFNRIYRKLHYENFSVLICWYGKHRTGKSKSAVSFSYILDPTFETNMDTRIVYSSKDLIKAFRAIRQQGIKGAAIVVDEAGAGDISSQRWYEDMAKLISANLQAVGYLNPIVSFVTQSFSFINNTARKLSQGVFEVSRTGNHYVRIKPFWIENNPWISGFYRKYPIFCENRDGIPSNLYKISRIKLSLLPEPLNSRYEVISQAYKDKLLQDTEEEMDAMEQEKVQKKALVSGFEAIATEIANNVNDYMVKGSRTIDENLIRHRHGLSYRDTKLVRALALQQLDEGEDEAEAS